MPVIQEIPWHCEPASLDNWQDDTSRSAMYGKGGSRKGRVAVQICRSCHPFKDRVD